MYGTGCQRHNHGAMSEEEEECRRHTHIPRINKTGIRSTPDRNMQFSTLADNVPICSTLHLQKGRSVMHNLHRLPTPLGPAPKLRIDQIKLLQQTSGAGSMLDPMDDDARSDTTENNIDGVSRRTGNKIRVASAPPCRLNQYNLHKHRPSAIPKSLAFVESDDEEGNANHRTLSLVPTAEVRGGGVGAARPPRSASAQGGGGGEYTKMSPKRKPPALPLSHIQGLLSNTNSNYFMPMSIITTTSDANNISTSQEIGSNTGRSTPTAAGKVKVCSYIMRRVAGEATNTVVVDGGYREPSSHSTLNSSSGGGRLSSGGSSRPGTVSSRMGGGRLTVPPTAYRHTKPFGTFSIGTTTTLQPPKLTRLSPALQRAISPACVVTPTMLRAASSPCPPQPMGIDAPIPGLLPPHHKQHSTTTAHHLLSLPRTPSPSSSSPSHHYPTNSSSSRNQQHHHTQQDIITSTITTVSASGNQYEEVPTMEVCPDADYHTPFENSFPLISDFDHIGGCEQHISHFEQRQQARIELDQAAKAARQITGGSVSPQTLEVEEVAMMEASRVTDVPSILMLGDHVHIEESEVRPPVHQSVLDSIQQQYVLPEGYGGNRRGSSINAGMGDGDVEERRANHDPLSEGGEEDEEDEDGICEGVGIIGSANRDASSRQSHRSNGGGGGSAKTANLLDSSTTTSIRDVDASGQQLVGTLPRSVFHPPKVIKMLFNFTAVQRLPSISLLRKVGYPVLYERLLGASNKRRSSISRQDYFAIMKDLVPYMPVKDALAILNCVDRTEHGDVDVDVLLLSVQMLLGSATPGDVLRFCIKALDPLSSEPRYISRYEIQSMLRAVQQLSTMGHSSSSTPGGGVGGNLHQGGGGGGGGGSAIKGSLPSVVLTPSLITSAAAIVGPKGTVAAAQTFSGERRGSNSANNNNNNSSPHARGGSGGVRLNTPQRLLQVKKRVAAADSVSLDGGVEEAVDKEFTVMFAGISELLHDTTRYDRHGQMPLDIFITFLKERLRAFGGPIGSSSTTFGDRRGYAGAGRVGEGERVRGSGGSSKVVLTGASVSGGGGRGGVLDGARLIAPAHRLSSKLMILQHVHEASNGGQHHTNV